MSRRKGENCRVVCVLNGYDKNARQTDAQLP